MIDAGWKSKTKGNVGLACGQKRECAVLGQLAACFVRKRTELSVRVTDMLEYP